MLSIATRGRGLQPIEVLVEARAQNPILRSIGARFRHHDEVPTGQRLLHAKCFPREAFQLVSIDRSLGRSPRDRQPEAGDRLSVRPTKDREEAITRARRLREDAPELLRSV